MSTSTPKDKKVTTIQIKIVTRGFLNNRAANPQPLPSCEEIRRQMGWDLIKESSKL
jgi:hypothetical protein